MSKSTNRWRFGFTFVEIFIVILVLGILAAVAAPQFDSWIQQSRVRSASQTLVADLAHASTAARTQGQEITVQFDFVKNGYQIPSLAHPRKPLERFSVLMNEGPLHATITEGTDSIVFDKYGHAKADGKWVLASNGSNWLTVKIQKSTSAAWIE